MSHPTFPAVHPRRAGLGLIAVLALQSLAHAGGPLDVCGGGSAFLWPMGGLGIPFNPDQGNLGPIAHADAVALVRSAFEVWEAVPSATATYVNAGELPVDVDVTNFADYLVSASPDGLSAVIFDDTGEIFDLLFGPGSGILGFAGPEWVDPSRCTVLEGLCFLNGPAFTDPVYAMDVMVHEFGHYSGLGHTVVNGQIFIGDTSGPTPNNSFGFPDLADVETLYPYYFGPGSGTASLAADDIANLSALYPAPDFSATTATIEGVIFAGNGTTPLDGVNVIARNLADPFGDAHSAISGDFSGGPGDPRAGTYRLEGLKPGASYVLFVDQIEAGGFSTPPSALPGPEEFHNGARESNNLGARDDPSDFQAIVVGAGGTATGINVIFNLPNPGEALPVGDDDGLELALPFRFTLWGQTFESVFVNANGSLTFGAPDPQYLESAAGFLSGPPRIAALWRDLNPSAGGRVYYGSTPKTFRVTWEAVPEFPATGANTFFIELKKQSDKVDIGYGAMTAITGLVGISAGGLVTSSFEEPTDLSALTDRKIKVKRSPAIFELFTEASPYDLAGRRFLLDGFRDFNDKWAEPNDTIAKAHKIKPPFDSKDVGDYTELDPAGGDVDFFRFKARAGDILVAEILSGSFDSLMGLFTFDKRSPQLLATDDDSGAGQLSKIVFSVPESGDFALGVTQFPDTEFTGAGPGGGRYVLDVRRIRIDPDDVIVNGGFEAGMVGWTTVETGSPLVPWTPAGAGDGMGFDMSPTQPRDGAALLWHGFDGCGPMEFVLYQDIPPLSGQAPATLTWQERVQWNYLLAPGAQTLPRVYAVELRDPANDAVLRVLHSADTGLDPVRGDTGWVLRSADVSDFLGRAIRIVFVQSIPDCFTGPGQYEVDAVSLRLGGGKGRSAKSGDNDDDDEDDDE